MTKRKPPPPPNRRKKVAPPPPIRRRRGEPVSSVESVLSGADPWCIVPGNVLESLRMLPDNSVHHVTTSPPYWSLRDYGVGGTVWGGDKKCDHRWSSELGQRISPPQKNPYRGSEDERGSTAFLRRSELSASCGYFCVRCGAWFGALGLEPDPNLFVYHLILIFREVRRALHPSGSLLLNLGDSFFGNSPIRKSRRSSEGDSFPGAKGAKNWNVRQPSDYILDLKPKDRVMLPHRVAMAMQKPWLRCKKCRKVSHGMWWGDLGRGRFVCPECCKVNRSPKVVEQGWYIRLDNVWDKPTFMPDPTSDRPSCSHEYIFLCVKSRKYFWHSENVRTPARFDATPAVGPDKVFVGRTLRSVWRINPAQVRWDFCLGCDTFFDSKARRKIKKQTVYDPAKDAKVVIRACPVCGSADEWVDHFAMFPSEIPEIGIRAGTSSAGCCAKCRAPYVPVTESISETDNTKRLLGYEKGCKCKTSETVPCTVVDVFNGGGTTGLIAKRYMRGYIGFDLNPSFVKLTNHRMRLDFPLGRFLATAGPDQPVGPPKPGGPS